MGDVRYEAALRRVQEAEHRAAELARMRDEEVIAALAAASRQGDPYLANVIATEALNRSHRQDVILEHLSEGVVSLDRHGCVRFANGSAKRLLYARDVDLLEKDFHERVHHSRVDEATGSVVAVVREQCAILRAMKTGEMASQRGELFHRTDGSSLRVAYTAAPVERSGEIIGCVVLLRDITKKLEQEKVMQRFRVAAENAPLAVYWVARDATIRYANRRAAQMLGVDPEALAGLRATHLDLNIPPASWDDHWARVRRQGRVRMETALRHRDGHAVPVTLWIAHVEATGREFHCTFADERELA